MRLFTIILLFALLSAVLHADTPAAVKIIFSTLILICIISNAKEL